MLEFDGFQAIVILVGMAVPFIAVILVVIFVIAAVVAAVRANSPKNGD